MANNDCTVTSSGLKAMRRGLVLRMSIIQGDTSGPKEERQGYWRYLRELHQKGVGVQMANVALLHGVDGVATIDRCLLASAGRS